MNQRPQELHLGRLETLRSRARHTLGRVTASTRLRLRVSPGSGRAEIVGRHGDAWKVRVTEPPEHGRANDAVVQLLAKTLALPRDAVGVVLGPSGGAKA